MHEAAGGVLVGHAAEHGQHVLLPAQRIALVDGAVEMDGQMGNHQQRPAEPHGTLHGVQRVGSSQDGAAGERERAVEPGVEYGAAVHLGVELDDAAVAHYLACGLDAEARRIAVGGDDAHALVGGGVAGYEGEDGRTVDAHIAAVAGADGPCVDGA